MSTSRYDAIAYRQATAAMLMHGSIFNIYECAFFMQMDCDYGCPSYSKFLFPLVLFSLPRTNKQTTISPNTSNAHTHNLKK